MADTIFSAGNLLVAALLLWVMGWLFLIVNGRRPVQMRFKGLGVEVAISPCQQESCPLDRKENVNG